MLLALIASLMMAADAPTKPLPGVVEPDWNAWAGSKPEPGSKLAGEVSWAWATLREARADRNYATPEDRSAAVERVGAAHEVIDKNPGPVCAEGAAIVRSSADDWERLMVSSTMASADPEKSAPFVSWAMARAKSVDLAFEPVYEQARALALHHDPADLPAIFAILRAHDGAIHLQLHAWFISTHDCLFYVFGRYGRDAIPYLRGMLGHEDPYVRRNAAMVLGSFFDDASKPALLKMLASDDVGSGGAAFALGEMNVAEAVEPIARLLDNPDPRTRFWAAYALFEINRKEAMPALERRLPLETDDDARGEIEAAIEHLKGAAPVLGAGGPKLNAEALRAELQAADDANGLEGDVEAIARSATPADLETLERIRVKATNVPSDLGNRQFHAWTAVIKAVRRRNAP